MLAHNRTKGQHTNRPTHAFENASLFFREVVLAYWARVLALCHGGRLLPLRALAFALALALAIALATIAIDVFRFVLLDRTTGIFCSSLVVVDAVTVVAAAVAVVVAVVVVFSGAGGWPCGSACSGKCHHTQEKTGIASVLEY